MDILVEILSRQYKRPQEDIRRCLSKTAEIHQVHPVDVAEAVLMDYFGKLPIEILEMILVKLNPKSLERMCLASKDIQRICRNASFRFARARTWSKTYITLILLFQRKKLKDVPEVFPQRWILYPKGPQIPDVILFRKIFQELNIKRVPKRKMIFPSKKKEGKYNNLVVMHEPVLGKFSRTVYVLLNFAVHERRSKKIYVTIASFFSMEILERTLLSVGTLENSFHYKSHFYDLSNREKIISDMLNAFKRGEKYFLPLQNHPHQGECFILKKLKIQAQNIL